MTTFESRCVHRLPDDYLLGAIIGAQRKTASEWTRAGPGDQIDRYNPDRLQIAVLIRIGYAIDYNIGFISSCHVGVLEYVRIRALFELHD